MQKWRHGMGWWCIDRKEAWGWRHQLGDGGASSLIVVPTRGWWCRLEDSSISLRTWPWGWRHRDGAAGTIVQEHAHADFESQQGEKMVRWWCREANRAWGRWSAMMMLDCRGNADSTGRQWCRHASIGRGESMGRGGGRGRKENFFGWLSGEVIFLENY